MGREEQHQEASLVDSVGMVVEVVNSKLNSVLLHFLESVLVQGLE